MATQLSLYNGALLNIKERKLATLADNTEPRRVLDDVWAKTLSFCLEQGLWNFAVRSAKFTRETTFVASFGYANQIVKPNDFVRLNMLSTDDRFNTPLNRYTEEAGAWYTDQAIVYVSYISSHVDYGGNLARWPESFTSYVEWYLADKISGRLTGKDDKDFKKNMRDALVSARSKDAMNEPTKFRPNGTWTTSRGGGGRGDRRNRGSLMG